LRRVCAGPESINIGQESVGRASIPLHQANELLEYDLTSHDRAAVFMKTKRSIESCQRLSEHTALVQRTLKSVREKIFNFPKSRIGDTSLLLLVLLDKASDGRNLIYEAATEVQKAHCV
jgi:hypothetical protein